MRLPWVGTHGYRYASATRFLNMLILDVRGLRLELGAPLSAECCGINSALHSLHLPRNFSPYSVLCFPT